MQNPVTLYVEDFARMDESRRRIGEFTTREAALQAAQERVREELREMYQLGQNAHDLWQQWIMFGEDVFLVPDDPKDLFSALDFGRLAALQVASETARPLLLEVTCTDRITTASGAPSPPGEWRFWVHAPSTYTGASEPIRRATEELYREMSEKAREGDGSSYTLLDLKVRDLSEAEFAAEQAEHPRRVSFTVLEDGRLLEDS